MQQEIWISEEEKKRGYDNRLRGVSHLVWIREMHGVSQLINVSTFFFVVRHFSFGIRYWTNLTTDLWERRRR